MEPTELGEHGVHDRQGLIDGWDQSRLGKAKIGVVGAGGLGSRYLSSLARLGVGHLVFCDPDIVELSNLNRQSFYPEQKFKNKALSAAENLKRECTARTTLEAYAMSLQEALERYPRAFEGLDLLACLVDNEPSRNAAAACGLAHGVPTIFSAVSRTSLNGYIFVQQNGGPCFGCISTDELDAEPHRCADPTAVYIHEAAMGITSYATVALLMDWKLHWNYYSLVLDSDSHAMNRPRRTDCGLCKEVR
jgi:molybdopterin/thiamine biosynthesis adenylyltransferase